MKNFIVFGLTQTEIVPTIYHIPDEYPLQGIIVFNTTFNNISVILWRSVLLEENRRKPPTCRKSLTNVASGTSRHDVIRIHNFSGDRH